MRFIRGVLLFFAVIFPVFPLFVLLGEDLLLFYDAYYAGIIFGVMSYFYFITVLILSSRVRILDLIYGHDKVMIFHGILAAAAFISACFHFTLKFISYGLNITVQSAAGSIAVILFIIVMKVTVLFMVDSPFSRISFISGFKNSFLKNRIDYTQLKLFHNLTFAAVLFMIFHVFMAESVKYSLTYKLLMIVPGIIGSLFYFYHKVLRIIVLSMKSWEVVNVEELNDNVTRISMKKKKGGKFNIKSGQFCFFRFKSGKVKFEEHPFTVSSSPDSEILTITVKKLGDYTMMLKDLKKGDTALIDGPYGRFTPEFSGKPFLFIAGGIGITPFLSILEERKRSVINSKLILVWAVSSETDLIERDLFDKLKAELNEFEFIPVISGKKVIDDKFLKEVLQKFSKEELKFTNIYFCGPPGFRKMIFNLLVKNNIRKSKFHYEKFSL